MRINITRKILVILGIAVAVSVIAAISAATKEERQEPIPSLVILYNGIEHPIGLEGYYWQGKIAPGPNAHFHYPISPINITRGQTIEFVAKNATRQPSYYEVSVTDTIMRVPEGSNAAVILGQARIEDRKLLVNFDKSTYFIQITGY